MARDWVSWHEGYEVADSSLARRLTVVQRYLTEALATTPAPRRLTSLCAGDGRDVLPVLASHNNGRNLHAVLIEISPSLSTRARSTATDLNLPAVEVLTADAGATATYAAIQPADILLTCGVFGNVTHEDMCRTVAALASLTNPGATVIWTRGRGDDQDHSLDVRAQFRAQGFTERAFCAPDDARFRVGVARRPETSTPPLPPHPRLFTFR